jgi:hypothetical protein
VIVVINREVSRLALLLPLSPLVLLLLSIEVVLVGTRHPLALVLPRLHILQIALGLLK